MRFPVEARVGDLRVALEPRQQGRLRTQVEDSDLTLHTVRATSREALFSSCGSGSGSAAGRQRAGQPPEAAIVGASGRTRAAESLFGADISTTAEV